MAYLFSLQNGVFNALPDGSTVSVRFNIDATPNPAFPVAPLTGTGEIQINAAGAPGSNAFNFSTTGSPCLIGTTPHP